MAIAAPAPSPWAPPRCLLAQSPALGALLGCAQVPGNNQCATGLRYRDLQTARATALPPVLLGFLLVRRRAAAFQSCW